MAQSISSTKEQALTERKGYTLYVSNLPEILNITGVQSIFMAYGKITGFFYQGANWAYVTYRTYSEAENAIKDLHDQSPLFLKVTLAKDGNMTKCVSQFAAMNLNECNDNITQPYNNATKDQRESRKEFSGAISKQSASELQTAIPKENVTNEKSHPNYTSMQDLCKDVNPKDSTDALWSKNQVTITADGKRHVSFGRGYTMYEVQNPPPGTETLNSYTHGENKFHLSVGKCNTCAKETKHRCEACCAFYCSKTCQTANRPNSANECKDVSQPVPATAPFSTDKVKSFNQGSDLPELRRPKMPEQCTDTKTSPYQRTNNPDTRQAQSEMNHAQKNYYNRKPDMRMQTQNNNKPPPVFNAANATSPSNQGNPVAPRVGKTATTFMRPPLIRKRNQIAVNVELTNGVYKVTVSPSILYNKQLNLDNSFETFLSNMQRRCSSTELVQNFMPSKGELVCGQTDNGTWIRGYVTQLQPQVIMYAIDEGKNVKVKIIQPCAEEFTVVEAICVLSESNDKLQNTTYVYKINDIRITNNQVILEIGILVEAENYMQATLKPCVPEREAFHYVELKTEAENLVCISAYHRPNKLFVRSLREEDVLHFNRLMQETERYALKAPSLKVPPNIGDMVIARYIDDNHYRAIVTKVTNESIGIFYVDFGNMEKSALSKLKVMPSDLKKYRTCITPINIQDVPDDVAMTKECNDYLVSLTGEEVPLLCHIESADRGLVHLKTMQGVNVCSVIKERLTPSWKKNGEDDKICYTLKDIGLTKLGNVGESLKAGLLQLSSGNCCLFPIDNDLIAHIFKTMAATMKQYCESNEYYIPRDGELCLAQHSGNWYRAVCINRAVSVEGADQTASCVFFLDNAMQEVVQHKDIRYMPKDFLEPAALANTCRIVNFAPQDADGQFSPQVQKRLEELAVPFQPVDIKIVNYDEYSGEYMVEFPTIRNELKREGLIP